MNSSLRNALCTCGSGRRYKHCCGVIAAKPSHQPELRVQEVSPLAHALNLHQAGQIAAAELAYQAILDQHPDNPHALHYLGVCKYQQGEHERAVALIRMALSQDERLPMAQNNLGLALKEMQAFDEALQSFSKAIEQNPDNALAYNNRGLVFHELKSEDMACRDYESAVQINPGFAEALLNLGKSYGELKNHTEAIACFDRAIALKPDMAEAYASRGQAHHAQNHAEAALADYERATTLLPDVVEYQVSRCGMLYETRRYEKALACYDGLMAKVPDSAVAHANRGNTLSALKRYEEATQSLEKALAIQPDLSYAAVDYLFNKLRCCNWENLEKTILDVLGNIDKHTLLANPLPILAIPSTPMQQQRCAMTYVQDCYPAISEQFGQGESRCHDRIRIAYFSSDFRDHPVAHLTAQLFEYHDRAKFEVFGISTGVACEGAWRKRLSTAFDHFHDVSTKSDQEIAETIRQLEIDILINLNGHTAGARTTVFAYRPAPVQVNYLGFPGTMGADYIDYVIADPVVIPHELRPFYTEKIACLPHCYMTNDTTKTVSDREFSRAELGLPENGFVFCCFNNHYKISPDVFDIWMRLLMRVEGSVLWLRKCDANVMRNLREQAQQRSIDPDRLVFASRMERLEDHLARHRQADLFLDTFYYGAHTTASDALWAGLPVLTRLGDAFAGRVAASLLKAAGLSELIAATPEAYETLALELAKHPLRLAALRSKLATNRDTQPIFDTALFTRHIETAYLRMWKRAEAGLPPDDISVPA